MKYGMKALAVVAIALLVTNCALDNGESEDYLDRLAAQVQGEITENETGYEVDIDSATVPSAYRTLSNQEQIDFTTKVVDRLFQEAESDYSAIRGARPPLVKPGTWKPGLIKCIYSETCYANSPYEKYWIWVRRH